MPSHETFSIKPIAELLDKWLEGQKVIIDPFARDSKRGTITNDLNPKTSAQYHMDCVEFLQMLIEKKTQADVFLNDPPYSVRQVAECYQQVGRKVTQTDTQASFYTKYKVLAAKLVRTGGIVISCGWNSMGIGKKLGFEIEEILLVPHGGVHSDTIVTVERKQRQYKEPDMFAGNEVT